MIEIANAINSLPSNAMQADFVPTSEQLVTLTYGQLPELITQAVQKATQPLQDRISSLEDRVGCLDKENTALRSKVASLERTQDTQAENQLIQLRLINDLREAARKDPQPMQKGRVEILRALLAANGGKMLAKDARQKMHLKKNQFSELLAVCDFIDLKSYHLDGRKKVIILKSELVQ